MQSPKFWVKHNLFLKILSLILAGILWMTVAHQASSEIGLEVPLEYRNIPPDLEIAGDTTNTVEVRLRGSSNVIRDVTAKNVSTTIDLINMQPGEKIVALSPQNVQAPFGAEVIRVNPSTVRFTLERTIIRTVPIVPATLGQPADGYEVARVVLNPMNVEVEGPESRINTLTSIATVLIRLEGRQSSIEQTADLDVPDPQVRLRHPSPVSVKVEIRHQGQR